MEHNSLKRIDEIVKSLEPELKELALKIHANPELGNQEFKACRWQMELLEKYGFEERVQTAAADDHDTLVPTGTIYKLP